jgi:hypothetical protein
MYKEPEHRGGVCAQVCKTAECAVRISSELRMAGGIRRYGDWAGPLPCLQPNRRGSGAELRSFRVILLNIPQRPSSAINHSRELYGSNIMRT